MSRKIVFKISKDGDVLVDKVEGFGSNCLEATRNIERALGRSDESSRRFTDEYNEPVESDHEEHIEL